ncbi:MAG: right-handed parallel beta-helix repeat-containing protein, partial [Chloroflexota bacterium]|nr:right-handed parallel beta-helix repeat-containing protein [Chloroflexota bacterium]
MAGTSGRRRCDWARVLRRVAWGTLFMALALLSLATQPALAAPPVPPNPPAPLVPPSTTAPAAPHRNTISPNSVSATYWVGTTADTSAATDCTTQGNTDCSLRQAVTLANTNAGVANTINFQIAGAGVQTITVGSEIDITNRVVIDGYTEPGARVNTQTTLTNGTNAVLTVRVDGNGVGINGLVLAAGSDASTIRGLSVTGFGSAGIQVASAHDVIAGNWIGVAPDGTKAADSYGVGVEGATATIGGTTPADRNLISGNNTGVGLQSASSNVVEGNLIG